MDEKLESHVNEDADKKIVDEVNGQQYHKTPTSNNIHEHSTTYHLDSQLSHSDNDDYRDCSKTSTSDDEPELPNSCKQLSDDFNMKDPKNISTEMAFIDSNNSSHEKQFKTSNQKNIPGAIYHSPSLEGTSLTHCEEFSDNEITEAKNAIDTTEKLQINPDMTCGPEPHSASPIREVLSTLKKEAAKYRNIQETCNDALEELASSQKEVLTVRSYCFLPLKLAYDTKLPRFCILAVTGFRHLLSDPLLKATSLNPNKTPLAVKIVELILRYPGTNDEHFHEIYKLCLAVVCTDHRLVHHEQIIKILDLCLDQAVKHKETSHKALAHSTFLQVLSQLPRNLPSDGILQKFPEVEDLIAVVKWLVDKVPNRNSTIRQQAVIEVYMKHYLDGLVTLLSSTPSTMVQHSEFTDIIWQKLCPALIQLLGNPMVDKAAKRGKVNTAQPHTIKDLLHIHTVNTEMTNSCTRSCHSIATQLVRLVGHQAFLRPVLASLFHRIIMFPPPHLRKHALEGVKEVFKNPQLLTDLCVVQENEVARIDFALLKMLIDGVTQSSLCGDSTMLGMSASVIVSLLDSIQQLSCSTGVTAEHKERISGAIEDMDSHMQPAEETAGDESETISETDDVIAPLPIVQKTFFSSTTPGEVDHQQTDLVRTEREEDSDIDEGNSVKNPENSKEQDSKPDADTDEQPDKQSEEIDVTDTVLSRDIDLETSAEQEVGTSQETEDSSSAACSAPPTDEEERQSAKSFVKSLLQALTHLLNIEDPHTLDLSIQQFASDMCGQVRKESAQQHLLNADSMYVTTYMALDLTRRLHQANFYSGHVSSAPVTEVQFLDWVQESGGMILVSPVWLQEVYKTVLEVDMLELSEFDLKNPSTLISLLQKFSQVQKTTQPTSPLTPCQRFARFLLSGTWEQILQVLQNPIEAPHKLKARLSEVWAGSKSLTTRTDLICCCLDGLRRAASLSCKLGMQNKCTTVISHLANISCSSVKRLPIHKDASSTDTSPELRVAHVLSMDALLNVGLDVGQFESKCWKHVFKCCAYISLLEHTKFAQGNTLEEGTSTSPPGGTLRELMMSEEAAEGGVAELLQQENQQDITNTPRGLFSGSYSGVIQSDVSTKAVALLASSADKLFSTAVSHLSTEPLSGGLGYCSLRGSLACKNTAATSGPLGSFLEALVKSSQIQLFGRPLEHSASPRSTKAMSRPLSAVATSVLHLHRLTELVLVCSRCSHSLLNMMQVWSIVANHFTEAACHADRTISKLAITSYHQILTEVMRKRVELPHFSFNEALLKPMEDMLSLGLCDMETQDHIVSCLCELTEANAREMKSGWKALFRSLRSVKVPVSNEEDTWTTPVFEVVSVVLERDDVFIFSDAIIDCVMCLQKFICSGSVQQSKDSVFRDPKIEAHNARLAVQLGLPSLKYLSRIATMLSIMYGLEQRPFFAGSDRIKVPSVGLGRDSEGRALFDFLPYNDESGLLKVWWIMIQGMCSTVLECHQQVQAQTMETVYSMLRALAIIPGPQFQILVMCHELFPMLTSWVKRSSRLKWSQNESMESNFKHACGLAIELVSETITSLKTESNRFDFDTEVAINSLLQHVMVLLTACVKQPLEGVARVGCSCIRHLLFNSGKQLGDHLNVVCHGLADACTASLEPVQLVLIPFNQPVRNEGDDNGLVRVYARKDTPSAIANRLTTLTQQVFLDDKQYTQADMVSKDSPGFTEEKAEQYMRSYVIAWPPDRPGNKPSRVPFSDLVIGLLAHSLLVQTINDLFVGDKHPTAHKPTGLSDLLRVLTPQTMSKLLDVVWDSYELCVTFNNRPGLRYLIQKVGTLHDYTPGLVKQAQKSYVTYINTILFLRINVKKQKDCEGEKSGSYSHAGLSLESIDTSWEGILDTCLKEASRQLCSAYSMMNPGVPERGNMVRQTQSPAKKGSGKRDSGVNVATETIEEKLSINDIEHWTSTVVSVLNMYYELSDDMFELLLPAIYPSTVELCVNVTDHRVRSVVKDILERAGRIKLIM